MWRKERILSSWAARAVTTSSYCTTSTRPSGTQSFTTAVSFSYSAGHLDYLQPELEVLLCELVEGVGLCGEGDVGSWTGALQ